MTMARMTKPSSLLLVSQPEEGRDIPSVLLNACSSALSSSWGEGMVGCGGVMGMRLVFCMGLSAFLLGAILQIRR